MEQDDILGELRERLNTILDELGAEVVEFTLKRAGKKLILRLLADKEGGITMDECALINRRLGNIIDENSIINEGYLLEVSSPGLDRPLRTKRDFERAQGEEIEVWLSAPEEGRNYLSARIKGADEQRVLVEDKDAKEISLPYRSITKARLKLQQV